MLDWLKRRRAEPTTAPKSTGASQEWKTFEEQKFWHLDAHGGPQVLERFVFQNCQFFDCHTKPSKEPHSRSVVRDITLIGCGHAHGSILGSIVEDVKVEGLKSYGNSPFFAWGAVFKHVVLKGRISSALLNREIELPPDDMQREWDEANAAFYAGCDWAFDISEAKFTSCFEFRSVPGRLIRRDPETQILVTRDRVQNGRWQALDIGAYSFSISMFLETDLESMVLAAPRANRKFKEELAYLQLLRQFGFAEPD